MTHIVELILNLAELSCFPLDAYSEIGLKRWPPYLKLNMPVTFHWLVKTIRGGWGGIHVLFCRRVCGFYVFMCLSLSTSAYL